MQEPDESVQDVGANVPALSLDHVTVPVGISPTTVAVHWEAVLTAAGEGEQVTEALATLGGKLRAISIQPSLVAETKGARVEPPAPQTSYSLACHPPFMPHWKHG